MTASAGSVEKRFVWLKRRGTYFGAKLGHHRKLLDLYLDFEVH